MTYVIHNSKKEEILKQMLSAFQHINYSDINNIPILESATIKIIAIFDIPEEGPYETLFQNFLRKLKEKKINSVTLLLKKTDQTNQKYQKIMETINLIKKIYGNQEISIEYPLINENYLIEE